jgi:hypothetical protein
MIAAATLVEQVRSAAPFLFDGPTPAPPGALLDAARAPRGWLDLVHHAVSVAARPEPEAYFLVCLACHQASVGTFVPTDVDGKIRGLLWGPRAEAPIPGAPRSTAAPDPLRCRGRIDEGWLARQARLALHARLWDTAGVAARRVFVAGQARPVGGHDGEHLSVLIGALGALVRAGLDDAAAEVEAAIEDELAREASALLALAREPGAELDLLRLAALLTHNQGDVDQGLSYWPRDARLARAREAWSDLAHQPARHGGAYALAARLYGALLAAEGHRHYPLRAVRALRRSPDLLLPLGPFFDEWGRTVARHPALDVGEIAEVAAALLLGCRKVAGQEGYFRALAGLDAALPRGLVGLERALPGAARGVLKDAAVRRKLAVPQASFESSYRKRARSLAG